MCRQQLNQFLEYYHEKQLKNFMATSLDYTIDRSDNVILRACPLCFAYKPKAYIFVCGCDFVGLLCEHCLNWLEEEIFICVCFQQKNFQLMPLSKERIFPLLHERNYICLNSVMLINNSEVTFWKKKREKERDYLNSFTRVREKRLSFISCFCHTTMFDSSSILR